MNRSKWPITWKTTIRRKQSGRGEGRGQRGRGGRDGATKSSSFDQATMACMVVFLISGGGGVVRAEAKVAATWLSRGQREATWHGRG